MDNIKASLKSNMSFLIFLILILSIVGVIQVFANSAPTHTTSLTISNSAPIVYFVESVTAVDLTSGGYKTVNIQINVSDTNGASDINNSNLVLSISSPTLVEQAWNRSNSTPDSGVTAPCNVLNSAFDTNERSFTCNITFAYYDGSATWRINASINDSAGAFHSNQTQTIVVNSLDSVSLNSSSLNCGSLALGSNNNPCGVRVNNTGNTNYGAFNLTGRDLDADTDATEYIVAGNLTANNSATPAGQGTKLLNGTQVNLTGSYSGANIPLAKGNDSAPSEFNWTVHYQVDIPSEGLIPDTYTSTGNFIITAIT